MGRTSVAPQEEHYLEAAATTKYCKKHLESSLLHCGYSLPIPRHSWVDEIMEGLTEAVSGSKIFANDGISLWRVIPLAGSLEECVYATGFF